MKVFYTKKLNLKEELEKVGKVFLIKNASSKVEVTINNSKIEVDLKDVLEFLANQGYDFVILDNNVFNAEAESVEEVLNLEDFETLTSLIKNVKKNERSKECGAIGIFVGFVREISDGKRVLRLEYEKFDEIFEKKLREIEENLKKHEGVVDVKIHHKSGVLMPKEDIVYVVVMGKHRKDVWEPLIKSMEIIKKELPIWKKEIFSNGEIWIHDKKD